MIYVIEGEIEQWVDGEKRILRLGDSAFIAADVVHASFNTVVGLPGCWLSWVRVSDPKATNW